MRSYRKVMRLITVSMAILFAIIFVWEVKMVVQITETFYLLSIPATPNYLRAKAFLFFLLTIGFIWLAIKGSVRYQALIIGTVGLVFIGFELFLMVAYVSPGYNELTNYLQPYVMFSQEPFSDFYGVQLSELGYRDHVPDEKLEDEYRVIVIGGSTVFNGYATRRKDTIVAHLENMLNEQFPEHQVRVYNWGVFGAVSGQELATILYRAAGKNPDMVVVYDGYNDLVNPYFYDPRPGYPYNFMALEAGQRITSGEMSFYDMFAMLLRKTHLGTLMFQHENVIQLTDYPTLRQSVAFGSEAWRIALVESYHQHHRQMCQMAVAFDYEFVSILQPMVFFKEPLTTNEAYWKSYYNRQFYEHVIDTYALASASIPALQAEQGDHCVFYDASLALQSVDEQIFTDMVHLNHAGYRIMAEYLADLITPVIEADLEQPSD